MSGFSKTPSNAASHKNKVERSELRQKLFSSHEVLSEKIMFLSLHAPPTPFHHTAVKTKRAARSAPGTVGTAAGAFLTGISNEQFTVERTEIKTHALY